MQTALVKRASGSKRLGSAIATTIAFALVGGCAVGTAEGESEVDELETGVDSGDGDAEAGADGSSGASGSGYGGSGGSGGSGGAGGSGGSGASSGGTGGSGTGGDGGTGGTSCTPVDGEPNNTEQNAPELSSMTDCDDAGGTVKGMLNYDELDWFTVRAEDKFGCSVNPFFNVASSDNIQLCVHFACDSGGTEVTCPSGSTASTSPGGRAGCCTSSTPLEPKVNCTGTLDETARIWIRASWPGNSACRAYEVEYHY